MTAPSPAPSARLPYAILAVMSVLCFVGPFGLRWVLSGGIEPAWPPDRPVEWVALIAMCSIVAILMVVLLVMNLRLHKAMKAARKPGGDT